MKRISHILHSGSRAARGHPKLTLAVTGIVTGGVFSWQYPPLLIPFMILSLFYLYFLSLESGKIRDIRGGIVLFLAYFVPYHTAVLSWFLDADLTGLAGISPDISLLASSVCLFLMVSVTTLAMFPLFTILHGSQRIITSWPILTAFLVAAGWILSEWLRSITFGAFLYGSEGKIGDFWNFGSLGLGVMNTPIAFASRLIGMYGLSFMLVFIAITLYIALFLKRFRPLLVGVIILVILAVIGFSTPSSPMTDIKYGSVLQGDNLPYELRQEVSIEDFSSEKKDIIVLPEYSYIYQGTYNDKVEALLNNRLSDTGFSVNVSNGSGIAKYGVLEFRDNKANILHTQTKEFLIPTGEYLPGIFTAYFNLTGQSRLVSEFDSTRKLIRGEPPAVYERGGVAIGPVACSGILGRDIYRTLVQNGASVLSNSASLSTFNGSRSYFRQSLQMARFHAIANAKPFIQSSKGAPAFVLDDSGSYIISPTDSRTKMIDFSFSTSRQQTFYTRAGEWVMKIVFIGLIVCVFIILKCYTFKAKKRPHTEKSR